MVVRTFSLTISDIIENYIRISKIFEYDVKYTNSDDEPPKTDIRQASVRNLLNERRVGEDELVVTINDARTSTKCKSKPMADDGSLSKVESYAVWPGASKNPQGPTPFSGTN